MNLDPKLIVLVVILMGLGGLLRYRKRKLVFYRERGLLPSHERKPVFDRERREFRAKGVSPIPFRDLEIRVFRYPGEQSRSSDSTTLLSWIGGVLNSTLTLWWEAILEEAPSGTEYRYRVYVRSGDTSVDLSEFRSRAEADNYADRVRELIREN